MKFLHTCLALGAVLAGQVAAVPHAPNPHVQRSNSSGFPSTNGLQFTIDGETQYAAGSNSYWIGFLTNNDDVDLVLKHMQRSDLKILRVWGFNDVNTEPSEGTVWYQKHSNGESTINTGKDGLQRLDYVVSSAEKHDVKLIINFVNNWDDYGGMAAYTKAYGGSHNDWYTNEDIQAAYQAYIKAVISRYKSSPAVFAWELANEPRCKGCDTSVLTKWITKTSKYIKSLDSRHMTCIGDGMHLGIGTGPDANYLQRDLDSTPSLTEATRLLTQKALTLPRTSPFPPSTLLPFTCIRTAVRALPVRLTVLTY